MNKVYFIAVILVFTLFLFSSRAVLSQQEEGLSVVSEYEDIGSNIASVTDSPDKDLSRCPCI